MQITRDSAFNVLIGAAVVQAVVMSGMEIENAIKLDAGTFHLIAIPVFNLCGLLLFFLSGSLSEKTRNGAILILVFSILIRGANYYYIYHQMESGLFDKVEIGVLMFLNTLILFFEIALYLFSNDSDERKAAAGDLQELSDREYYQRQEKIEMRKALCKIGEALEIEIHNSDNTDSSAVRVLLPVMLKEIRRRQKAVTEKPKQTRMQAVSPPAVNIDDLRQIWDDLGEGNRLRTEFAKAYAQKYSSSVKTGLRRFDKYETQIINGYHE